MRTSTDIEIKIVALGGIGTIPRRTPLDRYQVVKIESVSEDLLGEQRITLKALLDCASINEVLVKLRLKNAVMYGLDKAQNHRGISVGIATDRIAALLWVLCDDEGEEFASNESNHPYYGMPIFRYTARRYGFLLPDWAEAWVDGERCSPDCWEGCDI